MKMWIFGCGFLLQCGVPACSVFVCCTSFLCVLNEDWMSSLAVYKRFSQLCEDFVI